MIVEQIKPLFQYDDGSLPDLWIEGLSESELITIYDWVRSLTTVYDDPDIWSITEKRDLKVKSLDRSPARMFAEGAVEIFRHGLNEFAFSGVKIPQLSICVADRSTLWFDYRMGPDWGDREIDGLLEFLCHIEKLAPSCNVTRTEEGECGSPSPGFSEAFADYCKSHSN